MDHALDLQTLTTAVGSHVRLPDPATLRRLLAKTEISLFTQGAEIDDQVLDTGWYLQAVASAQPALGLYDLPRQRLAHQVSGHIFDLALQSTADLTGTEQLRLTFAAQVGYLGGDLTPNAAALARRAPLPTEPFDWSEPGRMSLEAGVLVLALDRPALYRLLKARLTQLEHHQSELGELTNTPYGAVEGVIRGALALTTYLTDGTSHHLDDARRFFKAAMDTQAAESDVDSRWVAAHLLRISGELATTSVWAVLPPNLPSAKRALTLGDPPVLSLWPPQLSFLNGTDDGPSPLDPAVRRLVLSFPTSAGKTLLAQILIVAHVASSAAGDVCVVAPTHSLCRELGHSLDRRLRTLGHQLYIEGPLGFEQPKPPAARVTVMTPEKLAALCRSNPEDLLGNYAMFVIDEAHLVADPHRGWRLEETLSLLHHLTVDTTHRILVLSAALGNQIHVIQWMTAAGRKPVQSHTAWRGPRRLNAVYTNEANWAAKEEVPAQGKKLARQHVPQRGVIHLRTSDDTFKGEFTKPVGTLVLRRTMRKEWVRDNASTTERERLVPLINHVASSGPVLVVQPTRIEAQRLAQDIAKTLHDDTTTNFALVDLTRARLGDPHPLTQVIRKGVAFHHAALPVDIQAEIEDAVRSGQIRILIATSTLIEGVNLPFKTVIVGRRGYTNPDGEMIEAIDAPALLNAVGRAGRAGRETEGWMILAEQSTDYSPKMFDPLQRTGNDLDICSTLTTEVALAALSDFETKAHTAEDAVFGHYHPATDGFLSFVWFVAQALADLRQAEASIGDVIAVVESTLAWQQLDSEQRQTLGRAARVAYDAFHTQPTAQRARWARGGTSLPTARILETVAERLLSRFDADPNVDLHDVVGVLDFVLESDTLNTLIRLPENDRHGFKSRRNAPQGTRVAVDLKALLMDWVRGVEIQDLADRHLTAIADEGYRSETMAEFSASVFEHHLPWTLGIVLQWVNSWLEAAGSDRRLPNHLPAAIHYGVGTETALNLMRGGIRSRRLANTVASHAPGRTVDGDSSLRDWLADQTITNWRELFEASPTEIADLLSFARSPDAQVVRSILEGEVRELSITASGDPTDAATAASLELPPNTPDPGPIQIVTQAGPVGTIRPCDHDEVLHLLNMGIPLNVDVRPGISGRSVAISLAEH